MPPCATVPYREHTNTGAYKHKKIWLHGPIVVLCATVYHCVIQRTHKHKSIQTQTNMAVLVEAQTVATCREIIVTTIVQQSGSLRAAFQTLMDFVRLLTPSRRVEKIPHGWDNRSNIERKPVDSMKRRMFVYLRIQSKTLFQGKSMQGALKPDSEIVFSEKQR